MLSEILVDSDTNDEVVSISDVLIPSVVVCVTLVVCRNVVEVASVVNCIVVVGKTDVRTRYGVVGTFNAVVGAELPIAIDDVIAVVVVVGLDVINA